MAKTAATVVTVTVLVIVVAAAGALAVVQAVFGDSDTNSSCTTTDTPNDTVSGYDPDQLTNAAIIVAVGKHLGVPEQGMVIAIATAMQESTLRNLNHGDRDSLGLFQQRPSQGWGTPEQLTDPTYAATQFYEHLLQVPGWQQMTLNDAAQTVQRSGAPNAYGEHEPAARAVVTAVRGAVCVPVEGTGDCTHIEAPNSVARAAINYACGQLGLPYVWGGNGPAAGHAGFDCSGLTKAAYAAAGVTLPRTAHAQYHAGPHVPSNEPLLPGDLVFYGNPNTKIHHVGLYIGDGKMINAPTFGKPVQIEDHRHPRDQYAGAVRPKH
jgi:cell wall-associated NlpC family hydrolase